MVEKEISKYYKVQFYDETSLSWVDIQKSWATIAMAKFNMPADKKCRIMEIDGKNREVVFTQ